MEIYDSLYYPNEHFDGYINNVQELNNCAMVLSEINDRLNSAFYSNIMLEKLVYGPIDRILQANAKTEALANEMVKRSNYIKKIASDCKWFPTALNFDCSIGVMYSALKKIENKTDLKNEIDITILDYYDRDKIMAKISSIEKEKISAACKQIIRESFESYIDKKYALCVFPLVMIWEGIIKEKYCINPRVKNVAAAIKNSIEDNISDGLYSEFYDSIVEYIGDDDSKIDPEIPR